MYGICLPTCYHKFASNAGNYISYTDPIWVMLIAKVESLGM